ncbi:MAG: hypothetical protein M3R06_01225 [Chloroflexota bacterium]|nr:hypothetical protein [Chloroflexota bacterium]
MSFAHHLPFIRALPVTYKINEAIETRSRLTVVDLPSAARSAVLAAALEQLSRGTLIIVSRGDRAESLGAEINEYLPQNRQCEVWPAPEALPYEQLPFDLGIASRRVLLLDRLCNPDRLNPAIIVASVHGLTQLLLEPEDLRANRRQISVGDRVDISELVSWATTRGYQFSPLVQEPGAVARRGGIVDIFPPGAVQPVRIDFFGDQVESIRNFNTSTQRSEARLPAILLLPPADLPLWRLPAAAQALAASDLSTLRPEVTTEWRRLVGQMELGITPTSLDLFAPYLTTRSTTLLDYLGSDGLVIMDDPGAIGFAGHQLDEQAIELEAGFVSNGELPAGLREPVMRWSTVAKTLSHRNTIDFGTGIGTSNAPTFSSTEFTSAPFYVGRLRDAIEDIDRRLNDGWRVVLATDQVERLTELLEERDIFPRTEKNRTCETPGPLPSGATEVRASDLDGGWMAKDARLLLVSDLELFGFRKQTRRGSRRLSGEGLAFASTLTTGEFVVHVDHGIAKFIGLVRMDTNGVEREYLRLEYAKGDKLYVPVDQSHRVTRYSGGGVEPSVSRLGSGEWIRTKQRVNRCLDTTLAPIVSGMGSLPNHFLTPRPWINSKLLTTYEVI